MAQFVTDGNIVYLFGPATFRDIGTLTEFKAGKSGQAEEAKRYGLVAANAVPKVVSRTTLDQMRAWASRPNTGLRAGPITPPTTTEKYTVKAGDTWDAIARAHGTDRAGLQKLNPSITNIENIIAGETVLNVPKR